MNIKLGKLVTGGVVAAALLFPVLTAADDDALPDAQLGDWKIGQTLRGDEVKAEDLEGKVVVIEYWGTR
jgi:hypothetical protein